MQSYSEYAYLLWLLTLCRLMGSSFGAVLACGPPPKNRPSSTALDLLDGTLSLASSGAFVILCCTLGLAATVSDSSPIRPDQQWLQWALFLLLCTAHLVGDNPAAGLVQRPGSHNTLRIVGPVAARAVVLALGCTAFHLWLGGHEPPAGATANYQCIRYKTIVLPCLG